MHKIAQRMYQALESGQDVVLATIVSQSGSTPRTAGTRMMILPDSTIVGTIGGGIIEARVIEAAADVRLAGEPKKLSFDLNQSGRRDNLDIICGGRLTVILEPVPATPDNIDLYRDCYVLLQQGVPCLVISSLFAEKAGRQKVEHCLCTENRVTQGSFSAPERLLKALTHLSVKERTPFLAEVEGRQFLVDPPFACGTVYIFGAGHVSQQLARLTGMVNFRTVVLDDRKLFANRERFPEADEVIVLEHFKNAMQGAVIDRDAYIVIVTRGHSHDKTVLSQALKTDAGYIGMIGSRTKRDTIYRQLEKEGFTREEIGKVKSPIGIDIGAETPEEIAISIIGELIHTRTKK